MILKGRAALNSRPRKQESFRRRPIFLLATINIHDEIICSRDATSYEINMLDSVIIMN
jgi:hypothetical protein